MPFSNADRVNRDFPHGDGEMAALMRALDWTKTPLGSPDSWPQGLRIAIRLILDSRHPMFIWWGPSLVQFYNDAFRQTLGPRRHPSALGQGGRECWTEIWDIIGPQIDFVMQGQGATWHEDHLVPITRHGAPENLWWTYGFSPIEDGNGGVGGVLVVCTDVTDRHQITEQSRLHQQTLEAKIAELDAIMAVVPAGIFISDDPLCLSMRANDEAYKLLQLPKGTNTSKTAPAGEAPTSFIAVRDGREIPSYDLPVQQAAREGRAVRGAELDFLFSDGRKVTIYGNVAPLLTPEGKPRGAVGAFIDITARKETELALKAANEEKGRMLATVSHDLRQPLQILFAAIHYFIAPTPSPERRERMNNIARIGLDRLTQMVDMLDEAARIESGNIPIKLRDVNIGKLIDQLTAQFSSQFENKNLRFKAYSPADVVVRTDMRLLSIVLQNFIQNAFKYTKRGGALIGCRRRGDKLRIQVFDTGPGIALDKIQETFVPFHRLDDGAEGGLGLGLAIVKGYADRLGHPILVSSVVGKGTCFSIDVPIADGPSGRRRVERANRPGDAPGPFPQP